MLSVGLDLSYRRTGICVSWQFPEWPGPWPNNFLSITNILKTNPGCVFERTLAIKRWVRETVSQHIGKQEGDNYGVIVVEGIALSGSTGVMMSGLQVSVVTDLYEKFTEIPILIIPPTSLKMYIGVGARDGKKPIVQKCREEICIPTLPDVRPITRITTDEADAFFMSKLGIEFLRECLNDRGTVSKSAYHTLFQAVRNKKGQLKGLAYRNNEYLIMPRKVTALTEKIELTISKHLQKRKAQIEGTR